MMLKGKMGVLDESPGPELPFASAIAEATGTFVSNRQPAGTHPCLTVSASTIPEPVGSRWTIHHPLDRERMIYVSPLRNISHEIRTTEMRKAYTITSNSSSCSAI